MMPRPMYARPFGPGNGPPSSLLSSPSILSMWSWGGVGALCCSVAWGPVSFSMSPPQYPPPQSRKTSAPCFGCHLQASVLFASVERSEGKLGILRLVSAFCPFIAFLRKECGAQELLPSGRWQRRQISDTVTWPLSACPKPQSPACRK